VLGVIAAQRDELLAHGAIRLLAFLALLGMGDHFLHLMASVAAAVRVSALASMNERLNAALHGLVSRVRRFGILRVGHVDNRADFLEFVLMCNSVIARGAQVEVVARWAMPAGIRVVAIVARVGHVLVFLSVKGMAEAERAILGSSQRAELPVFVSGLVQEGVSAVHQLTRSQWVGVLDRFVHGEFLVGN
jgi:hypothetical protein